MTIPLPDRRSHPQAASHILMTVPRSDSNSSSSSSAYMRFGIHLHLEDRPPSTNGGGVEVQRGLLSISRGNLPRRQLSYELHRCTGNADPHTQLLIVDVNEGLLLSVSFSDPLPRVRLARDSLTSVPIEFCSDGHRVEISGKAQAISAACRSRSLLEVLRDLPAELIVALDIITLTSLFGGPNESLAHLAWPDGPRRGFHAFATTLAASLAKRDERRRCP